MNNSFSESYKAAGVDVTAGYKSVELMKKHVARTKIDGVISGIGGFGGLFAPDFKDMEEPVLVSGTDGVGTKIKLAFLLDKHDTIGIDCVAMCVNDVACAGGETLFFLDYIACGKNYPEKIATIVSGVAEGCKQSDAALVGGETAEHPGLMPEDEYDLAGFAVGVVERKDLITGENIKPGDVLVGIASSGVHSNGFSLVRKVFDMTKESLDTYYDELGKTLLKAFVFALTQQVKLPKTILFYNGGAALNCEGSAMLEDLKALEAQGVEILTCGTCLNFYGLTEQLAVGGVTNMYVIAEKMLTAGNVVKP